MIDLSQIDEDKLDTFFAPTTLHAVMRIATESCRDAIQQRDLDLTITGVKEMPAIKADLQRLAQAFNNLIINAIKYTPDGGTITIQARQIDKMRFEVIVSDTGMGIDTSDQEIIFDKFFRVGEVDQHSSGDFKFKGGGPGLGLSISRGIVEAHGGRIWVKSEGYDEEKCPGSAFHVELPIKARPPVIHPD